MRPTAKDEPERPQWLQFLRSLLSGIYTIDNLDFVLRDAYMSGYSQRAFDLDRLLHYSFFSPAGLTIHDRGLRALLRFMGARAELFHSVYFHRTVRAIDLTLADLFAQSKHLLFPGNPAEHLARYLHFTELSLLVDVARWPDDADEARRAWASSGSGCCAGRSRGPWSASGTWCSRRTTRNAAASSATRSSSSGSCGRRCRRPLAGLPLRVDIARTVFRPHTSGPTAGQNFLYDSARDAIRPLTANQLFQRLPVSQRICRIYAESNDHAAELAGRAGRADRRRRRR